MLKPKQIEIHGHRGARGLFPENTITAFIEAVKLGVTALEIDVVISKDLKVVVSHEEWMNELFCTQPNGNEIEKNSKEKYNLYQMNYSKIASFDCGSKQHPEFPDQKNCTERKPLLTEVINTIEAFTKDYKLNPIVYNIEIKSEIAHDDIFHPKPFDYVRLVSDDLKSLNINERIIIQSFDTRILNEIKKINSTVTIGLLVENKDDFQLNLNKLEFNPDLYNPDFCLVTPTLVQQLHNKNIRIIPWTVNEIDDMSKLILMGVDGLITDYPNRAIELIKSFKL